jgi:hypothetical protein
MNLDEAAENTADSMMLLINKYFIPIFEFFIFKFLFTYNECLAAIQIFVWCAKKDYIVFSYIIDFLLKTMEFASSLFKIGLSYFLHSHVEPLYPNWICVIETGNIRRNSSTEETSIFFIEQYYKLELPDTNILSIANYNVNKKCNEYIDFVKHERIQESLILAKTSEGYISRILNKKTVDNSFTNIETSSTIEFMSIVYFHPESPKSIEIKLPREMYMVGNQILSISHVWRCIQYSSLFPNKIPFDMNYRLHIIDHNALRFEIGATDYIVVEEYDYSIQK